MMSCPACAFLLTQRPSYAESVPIVCLPCLQERKEKHVSEKTASLWSHLCHPVCALLWLGMPARCSTPFDADLVAAFGKTCTRLLPAYGSSCLISSARASILC